MAETRTSFLRFAVPSGLSDVLPRVGKEAGIAGLVALALTATMVGLRTVNVPGAGLTLNFRFDAVVMAVALVFFGRLALSLIREGYPLLGIGIGLLMALLGGVPPDFPTVVRVLALGGGVVVALNGVLRLVRGERPRVSAAQAVDGLAAWIQRQSLGFGLAALVFALAYPWIFHNRSDIDLAILVLTYIMLGWGLNIIVGLAGLLDLGYVAFYAVGAYSYALLAQYFGFSFWVCLPLAGLLAAFAGLVLGFPVLRLRGDYFAIVTLGFGEIIRIVLENWKEFTGGPDGVRGIPRPSFFGFAEFRPSTVESSLPAVHEILGIEFSGLHRIIFLFYLVLALALIVNFVSVRLRRLPLGRSWEALREDDVACQALGINRRNIKLAAFTISACVGGMAGAFFATRQGFISPESFKFIESAIILAIVVLGGMGSQAGIVVAALILIGGPEKFRELEEYRMLAFGALMVTIMVWRPRGLLAHREPSIKLGKRYAAGGGGGPPTGAVPAATGAGQQT